ncbi:hypothetical protein [Desulfosporosinus nitroreducens]|uniref:hypothetical protein n=1 Tax=Desulfosporosinus nitroreducens TaxID=2018668 RepID=UPI00207D355A|nr:hypothetical protein [Desulfosporosinus nitroreducens]MCO1599814.1 hypothetical protein [Desulfosporosinus nitroreducens]
MADKLVINCSTREAVETIFTPEEIAQQEQDKLAQEEKEQLDLLIPTIEEVAKAEFDLKTITLLQEVGLL